MLRRGIQFCDAPLHGIIFYWRTSLQIKLGKDGGKTRGVQQALVIEYKIDRVHHLFTGFGRESANQVKMHSDAQLHALFRRFINPTQLNTFFHGIQNTLVVGLQSKNQFSATGFIQQFHTIIS